MTLIVLVIDGRTLPQCRTAVFPATPSKGKSDTFGKFRAGLLGVSVRVFPLRGCCGH